MSKESLFEKLELEDEKNILIQGLPSSIEKQFVKVTFVKNVTPLIRRKKIDFALIFAVNHNQLCSILADVLPALNTHGKLWISYPKVTSKIVSDLNRECNWDYLDQRGYQSVKEVSLDHVWSAIRYSLNGYVPAKAKVEEVEKTTEIKGLDFEKRLLVPPAELERIFSKFQKAREFFHTLSEINQKEYVQWIEGAKRADTKNRRAEAVVEKLMAGKKTLTEK